MRTRSRWFGALAILTILAVVLSGCGSAATPQVVKETVEVVKEVEKVVEQTVEVVKEVEVEVVVTATPDPAAAAAEPVTLDFIFGSEPPTLDPALTEDTTSVWVVEQMFLALTDYDDDTLEVIPELATSWDVSEDGTVYTFHMRDDAKWVQLVGDEVVELGPVTANDVVYGILRTLDPTTAAPYSYVPTTVLVGAEEFAFADTTALSAEELQALRDGVGAKALDDYTVEFTLKQPAAYFPAMTSLWIFRPQPQATIDEFGDRWIEPGLIVTNGPYLLQEWGHGSHLKLIKNPLWYDADQVQIEVLNAPIVAEASTGMAMYENGEIDFAGDPGWGPPLPDMDRVKADPVLSTELAILPRLCTYYFGFVNTKAPMDDELVRKAFSYAIDRQTLIDTLLKGEQVPANSFTCPGIFGNVGGDPEVGLLFDPEKARQTLADAGYPNGEGLPPITLMINQSEAHLQIAQAIQAMWKEVLNVEVILEQQEWAVYLETLKPDSPDEDKPHIFRMGWCADYLDANNWLADVLHSNSTSNYVRFLNPEFDALVEQAQVESDPAVRADLYRQAEIILNNDVTAMAPIYFYTRIDLTKPYLNRIVNPLSMDHVWKWTIDWEAKKAATGR
ncbi:MAG: peptide ABC transporter substrate-binding protein [Anaerolineae bacterium]|nr:peptide ABC transporter substrate-binding protein [Anaerolineae bacterium]